MIILTTHSQPANPANTDTTITLQNKLWLALLYFLRNQTAHVHRAIRKGIISQDLTPDFSNQELMVLLRQVDAELTLALFPAIVRKDGRDRR